MVFVEMNDHLIKELWEKYLYSVNCKMYRKAVSILISIVLGALLLAGLYALFADTLLPAIQEKIMDIFDYAG